MESFFSRYKNALVLIVVLVVQLLALAVQVKRPASDSADQRGASLIRYLVVSVVTPPERLLHNIGLGIRGVWSGYVNLIHVRRENAGLKDELRRLRLEQASLAEDAKQGQRLQHLMGFQQHYIYKTVPAQVIGTSGTDQSRILYIDKGSKDGLAADMPVVTADGVVGKLKDVFDHTSQVLEISDATSGVGVILQTTRTRGILKGNSFGQLQVINVSPDERIKAGEPIVTSGGDQIFPRGIPVGTVDRVITDTDREPLVDVIIRPAANLSRLEEVLVVTGIGDSTSAQEAKDLAESEAEGAAEQKRASDVLSERLPGRIDPKAPADTNPDMNADNTGENVKLMTPPKSLHPDQFTPNATPSAAELTPGERRAPVLQGTEEVAAAPKVAKPKTDGTAKAVTPGAPGATARAAASTGAGGEVGAVRKPIPALPTGAAGAVARPSVSAGGGVPGATSAAGVPAARTASARAASTSPAGGALGSAAGAAKPVKATSAAAGTNGTNRTTGSAVGAGNGGGAASPSAAVVPRKAPAAAGTAAQRNPGTVGGTVAGTVGGVAVAPLRSEPKTRVIDDGPAVAKPKPAGAVATPAPVKKKGPVLVPDDGSRPPAATKPKPVQQSPTVPPQGDR
jgi:rod shape-determining protein MreC